MNKKIDQWSPSSGQRKSRDQVASLFGIEPFRMLGRSRQKHIVWPRHTAMWVIRQCYTTLSLPMIAKLFGRSDHSTVCYAIDKVEHRRSRDPAYRDLCDAIAAQVRERRKTIELSEDLRSTAASIADRPAPTKPVDKALQIKRQFDADIRAYPDIKISTLHLQLRGEAGCPSLAVEEIEARRQAVVRERKEREAGLLAQEQQRYGLRRRAKPLSEMVL